MIKEAGNMHGRIKSWRIMEILSYKREGNKDGNWAYDAYTGILPGRSMCKKSTLEFYYGES